MVHSSCFFPFSFLRCGAYCQIRSLFFCCVSTFLILLYSILSDFRHVDEHVHGGGGMLCIVVGILSYSNMFVAVCLRVWFECVWPLLKSTYYMYFLGGIISYVFVKGCYMYFFIFFLNIFLIFICFYESCHIIF